MRVRAVVMTITGLAELVEAPSFWLQEEKKAPSTSSGKPGWEFGRRA